MSSNGSLLSKKIASRVWSCEFPKGARGGDEPGDSLRDVMGEKQGQEGGCVG